jgi:hypothetical protein
MSRNSIFSFHMEPNRNIWSQTGSANGLEFISE